MKKPIFNDLLLERFLNEKSLTRGRQMKVQILLELRFCLLWHSLSLELRFFLKKFPDLLFVLNENLCPTLQMVNYADPLYGLDTIT